MKSLTKYAALLAVMAPLAATAQFSTGGDAPRQNPWEEFKLDSKKTVNLNFRNANVDLVLDLFMKVSGITIVKDPTLKEPMTVSSAKPVRLNEAFEILNAALSLRNYELSKSGNLLVIRKREERRQSSGFSPEMLSQFTQGSQAELKTYKIKYAAASQVADTINNVFQMQQASNPFAQFFGGGGGGFSGRRGRGGGSTQGFSIPGQPQQAQVRASSDEYSNTLIVYAPRDKQRDIEDLIAEIDQQTEQPVRTEVYPLEFGDATEITSSIQTVINSQVTTGRGAAAQNNQRGGGGRGGGGGGFFSFLFGGGQNSNVSADVRSNSVIVTTTEEGHKAIEQIIEKLDVEVPIENTTFIIPLNNARAENVASLLNSAFGSRTGTSTRNNNTRNNNNTNRTNRNNGNNQRGGLGGGRLVDDGTSLEIPLDDLYADDGSGELLTQIRFGQTGRTGGNAQQNSGLARGADGRLTNVRNLDGQVTIIPDPNTNSVIVVTDPENFDVVKNILGQLDKVPEQVMIETVIVEATLDKSLKLGVEWNFVQEKAFGSTGVTGNAGSDFGVQTPPNTTAAPEGFRYSLSGGNLSAFMNALASDDKFQVLSTPRIFTSNNVEAEINISQSVPYVLSTREDNNGNLTFNYAFQDVGIVLNVIPQISANGVVTLDVVQTANDLQGFTDFNAPIVNQRQAQTTVSVNDGETIILGGIMRDTVSSKVKKIPLLGDIPLLGELFKSTSKTSQKTELLVFLTPRVVRDPGQANELRKVEQGRLSPQSQKALDKVMKQPAKQNSDGGVKKGPKQPGK